MRERFLALSSKPVQISGRRVLCEDGSIWKMVNPGPIVERDGSVVANTDPGATMEFVLLSPPHNPPKQSDDLGEALAVLRRLVVHACVDSGHDAAKSVEAFVDARALLKKHGA